MTGQNKPLADSIEKILLDLDKRTQKGWTSETGCNNPECNCAKAPTVDMSKEIGASSIYRWHLFQYKNNTSLIFIPSKKTITDFLKNNTALYASNYFPNIIDKLLEITQKNNGQLIKKSNTHFTIGDKDYIILKENINNKKFYLQH